jgi:hypothetical protein
MGVPRSSDVTNALEVRVRDREARSLDEKLVSSQQGRGYHGLISMHL